MKRCINCKAFKDCWKGKNAFYAIVSNINIETICGEFSFNASKTIIDKEAK